MAALTIIFLLLYGYFSTMGKPLNTSLNSTNQGFADNKIALGNLGGFHLLKSIDYSDEKEFYRLLIGTELNRSTASPEDITIPYLIIEEIADPEKAGLYRIRVNLSDTQITNIPQDRPLAILPTGGDEINQPLLIKEVWASETKDEAAEIIISLTKKTLFRATADNSGVIVLDILK